MVKAEFSGFSKENWDELNKFVSEFHESQRKLAEERMLEEAQKKQAAKKLQRKKSNLKLRL